TYNAGSESVAQHTIADGGIAEANKRSLLVFGKANVFNVGVNALEVGMVEHVLQRCFEFQAGAFSHLDVLKQAEVGDVGDRILREVAASAKRRAKDALCGGSIDDVTNGVIGNRGRQCSAVRRIRGNADARATQIVQADQGCWRNTAVADWNRRINR